MLIILLGASGSGKTTIEKILEKSGIHRLRSHTTRPRKPDEAEDAYYFVKKDEFKKADIVESVLYKNNFFGLSRAEVKIAENKDCIVTLDWNGAQQIKRLVPFAATIYLDCPMYQLEKRIPSECDSQKRIKILEQIEIDSKCKYDCDYIVPNYDTQLVEAITLITGIYRKHNNSR
ncbi:MAG: guanylate kinase [Firmicutes bacterium]|nr:guanylate kinase [Bacillota bacterium]